MIFRAVMMSRAKVALGFGALNGELGRIISCSMMSCVDLRLTGALIWDSGYFMQVLEGDPDHLRDFMETVARDGRHQDYRQLEFVQAMRREYQTWSVGASRTGSKPAALIRKAQTIVPTADEVRTHVRHLISLGVVAETPPLVTAAA